MKNLRFFYLFGLFLFIISSCDKTDELIVDSPKSQSNLKSLSVDIDACNESPTVFELIAGQHIDVGQVTIVNDKENLYVTYETEGEWMLNEVHVFVGDLDDLPVNKKNTPVPGHFPYKDEGFYLSTYTVVIPLSEIDSCSYVFTHAVVVKEVMKDGEMEWADETAWGCGGYDFKDVLGTSRWGCFGEYCIEECVVEENYLTFKIFTSNSWTVLREGEKLYTTPWCNVMGVVVPEDGASYELTINGEIFAVAELSIEGNDLIVNINITDGTSELKKTYLFYGTLTELAEYGECPTYVDFPYNAVEAGTTHQIIIPL